VFVLEDSGNRGNWTKMTEVKLHLMLMGTTGHGKSATGNTLINKKLFIEGVNYTSETKEPSFSFTQFENKVLLVVDGPGLADTDMTLVQDREAVVKNMSIALGMCYGGVDAFIFVLKYGIKYTNQETSAIKDLKKIFGDNFMGHMIVVVTCGDHFHDDMANQNCPISFNDWCRKQEGEFQKLYKDCGGRVVLFNNRERDEEMNLAQRRKVVEMAEGLKNQLDIYTSICFQRAEYEREKMILEYKAPLLYIEIQEKIALLTADVEKMVRKPSEIATDSIRARVKEVKDEIMRHNTGDRVLGELQELLEKVESNLDDVQQLLYLAKDIDVIRLAQAGWGFLGTVCTFAGLLTSDISKMARKPSESAKTSIRARVKEVKEEIKKQDRGNTVLWELLELLDRVESNLNDVERLLGLIKDIDDIRLAQTGWGFLGRVCTFATGVLSLFAPPGFAVSATCAAEALIRERYFFSDVEQLEQNKKELENKITAEQPQRNVRRTRSK
jgi:GTPase Era involved in 16S rRNA processing